MIKQNLIVSQHRLFDYKKEQQLKKHLTAYRKSLIHPIDNEDDVCYNSYGDRVDKVSMNYNNINFS